MKFLLVREDHKWANKEKLRGGKERGVCWILFYMGWLGNPLWGGAIWTERWMKWGSEPCDDLDEKYSRKKEQQCFFKLELGKSYYYQRISCELFKLRSCLCCSL